MRAESLFSATLCKDAVGKYVVCSPASRGRVHTKKRDFIARSRGRQWNASILHPDPGMKCSTTRSLNIGKSKKSSRKKNRDRNAHLIVNPPYLHIRNPWKQ